MEEFPTIFPGFRFSPTDAELISHYLKRKIEGADKCDDVIPEVEICKFEPWDLPAKSVIKSDHEWFFFSPSGRKYPNGSQAKRATEVGFWKATGKERGIKSGSSVIGTKRTLVFHIGRAPKGERTEWIMHEYCLKGHKVDKYQESFVVCRIRKKHDGHNCESTSSCNGTQVGGDANATNCLTNKQKSGLDSSSTGKPDEICIRQFHSEIQEDKSEEDDCFAEILKNDIVKLDDTSAYRTASESPIVAETHRIPRNSNQWSHTVVPQMDTLLVPQMDTLLDTLQGTAQRRIRLHKAVKVGVNRESTHKKARLPANVSKCKVPNSSVNWLICMRKVPNSSVNWLICMVFVFISVVVHICCRIKQPASAKVS